MPFRAAATRFAGAGRALRVLLVSLLCLLPIGAAASEKVALIFGLGGYDRLPVLDNTLNDARDMSATLEGIGFDVTLELDATRARMVETLETFRFRAETAELALIYFAGHGVEVQGQNFLIPVDADPADNGEVQAQSLSLDQFLASVERARGMRIVILDSCRDNPLTGSVAPVAPAGAGQIAPASRGAASPGLAAVDPARGTLVAFAAKHGQVALDGTRGNSPYARALMQKMVEPDLEISLMFRQVRDAVLQETGNLQEPHTYGSLSGTPFYLSGRNGQGTAQARSDPAQLWSGIRPDQESQLLALAELGDTRSLLGMAYIRLNPDDARFSPDEAVAYLERAAKLGSPEAQMELAKLLEKGIGLAQDTARALDLYEAAAAQDYAEAINDLGFFHYHGALGLPQDRDRAIRLFERAAALRHPEALFNFAALIDDGLVDGFGPDRAAEYLYAALRTGNRSVLDLLIERPTMFTAQTRRALQRNLRRHEFYSGAIDGQFGAGTRRGLRAAYGLD